MKAARSAHDRATEEDLRTRLAWAEERCARAARAGGIGIWDWDPATDRFDLDPHFVTLLGYDEGRVVACLSDYGDLVHPEDADRLLAAIHACARGEEAELACAHRKVHRDGSVRWFLARATVAGGRAGGTVHLAGTDVDLTDRREAQGAPAATREELERSVAVRAEQFERARQRLRQQMEAREHAGSHREAVFLLRQRVWRMEDPADMEAVLEAVEASLEVAGVKYEQYGINLVVEEEGRARIRQSLKTKRGAWAYRDHLLSDPARILGFVTEGRIVYRRDLMHEDLYGDRTWAMQKSITYRSVIDVPFACGTLALNSCEPGAFDEAQVELLSDLAEVLAEAFQRARDLEGLKDRNQRLRQQLDQVLEREEELRQANAQLADKDLLLTALHDITTSLHEEPDEEAILDRFARRLFDMDILRSLTVAVVDEERHVVRIARSLWRGRAQARGWKAVSTAARKLGVEYDLDDANVMAETARTGRLSIIEGWDRRYDARFSSPESTCGQLAYFVPIAYLSKVTAVLATGSCREEKEEMLQMLDDLRPLFDHFAIALHHARLYKVIRERERQLRMAQKMEEMGQLTSGIAHNFNNLLQGVIGNLSLALDECAEPLQPVLKDALHSAQSQAQLVRQLMSYARRGPQPERTAVDVEQLLAVVTRMCRQVFDRRIEIRHVPATGVPPVGGDVTQLEQVLLNLCLNARDAVEEQREPAPAIEVDAQLITGGGRGGGQGDVVRIRVIDNGAGMPASVCERIFDPFFTTKGPGQGTGLGLSIVQGIVHQHGGWVECDSHPGSGTTFAVFLPITDRPVAAVVEEPGGDVEGHEHLLVVDDEPSVRRVIGQILRRHRYQVTIAAHGKEALECLSTTGADLFQLLLLDLSMPVMSGEEVLRRLPSVAPRLPVVVFTGYGEIADPPEQVRAVLSKPVKSAELLRTIRDVLDA